MTTPEIMAKLLLVSIGLIEAYYVYKWGNEKKTKMLKGAYFIFAIILAFGIPVLTIFIFPAVLLICKTSIFIQKRLKVMKDK